MIAEDIIGSKNTLFGINSDSEDIQFGQDGSVTLASGGDASDVVKFSEHLNTNGWNAQLNCGGSTNTTLTLTQRIMQTKKIFMIPRISMLLEINSKNGI